MASLDIAPSLANQVPKGKDVPNPQSTISVREVVDDGKASPNQPFSLNVSPTALDVSADSSIKLTGPAKLQAAKVPAISLQSPVDTSMTVPSTSKADVIPASSDVMHLTSLGAQILSSSIKPVASVNPPHEAVLTNVTPGSGAIPVISINDSTSPKNQEHAKVWRDALKAAQTKSPVVVNNETLNNPSLASADANQKMFKMSLADLVQAPKSSDVRVSATAAGPLLIPAGVKKDILANADFSVEGIQLPQTLRALTSASNKPQEDLAATTPPGFVLTGDSVKLFGLLDAERFTFHGNASPDGRMEMMILSEKSISLDQLFGPEKVVFGGLKLTGAVILLYPESQVGGQKSGLWLEAALDLSGNFQELASDLKSVLGQTPTEVQISGWLGRLTNWSTGPTLPEQLTLQGNIPQAHALLGKHVIFASANIDCQATKGTQPQSGKQVYTWSYTLSGDLNLATPGSITPLSMDYTMTKSGTQFTLKMHLDEKNTWNNAMGVHGMHLVNVDVTNVFDKSKTDGKEEFDLKAKFKSETLELAVVGFYGENGWSLNANCPSLAWDEVDALFNDMFGSKLQPFHHKVSLDNPSLKVSSVNKDVSLEAQLTINGWAAAKAEIILSSDGFHLDVQQMDKRNFQGVDLDKCKMEVFVGKAGDVDTDPKKPGTASFFTISGEIVVGGLTINAIAYLDKESLDSALAYVIYAECQKNVRLSSVKSSVGADLDLDLEHLVVIVANSDKLSPNMPTKLDYPVKKGFFLSAQVDAPRALTKALHMTAARIGVELDLGKDSKQLDFIFSSPQALVLKKGMSAPVVTAGIKFEKPSLFIKADMPVLLKGQTAPEVFELKGEASLVKATLDASLQTPWVNPFRVSPNVTILAPFGLGVVVDYASPIYPSGLHFFGDILLGKTQITAFFEVTDSPTDGVIFVEAKKLGIQDMISFASKVLEHDLPQPSTDFFEFEDLKLALSTGASVNGVPYPAGVTFAAAMLIFGKTVKSSAQISKSPPKLSIAGSIEAFNVGPLSITGHSSQNLSLGLEFSKDLQQMLFDGQIRLWELDVGVTLKAKLSPLKLFIDADLDFSDIFRFHVEAEADGEIHNLKELSKCDFTFEATLEQHIVEYIMAHANSYILVAKKAADEGIGSAEAKLRLAQKSFDDLINQKQAELNAAKAIWDKRNAATVATANMSKANAAHDEALTRQAVADAKKKFDDAIAKLETRLNQAKLTADAEIKKAKAALDTEKTKIDADVDAKVKTLQQAQASLSHNFGNADTALKNAENKVNDAQQAVNSKQRDIDSAKRDLSNASFFHKAPLAIKVAGLESEKVGLEAALKIAQGTLIAAFPSSNVSS